MKALFYIDGENPPTLLAWGKHKLIKKYIKNTLKPNNELYNLLTITDIEYDNTIPFDTIEDFELMENKPFVFTILEWQFIESEFKQYISDFEYYLNNIQALFNEITEDTSYIKIFNKINKKSSNDENFIKYIFIKNSVFINHNGTIKDLENRITTIVSHKYSKEMDNLYHNIIL